MFINILLITIFNIVEYYTCINIPIRVIINN